MKTSLFAAVVCATVAVLPVATPPQRTPASTPIAELEQSLREAEVAFAGTMASRDRARFASFLADETIFFGSRAVHRGAAAVAEAWRPYFDGDEAPFSWKPESVAVLASGELGFSSGPVFDPEGRRVGTFNSVWRRDGEGRWRIVFDRGCPPCGSD